ncbi:MAG: efflux RND transporter periplasmic adaptor subunit [Novosphingobium sp.]|nr:efflux RND transporter periplasmic adaptor subunit [Novosphingobium sp.]
MRYMPVLAAMFLVLAACSSEQPPAQGPVEVGYVTLTAGPVTVNSELTGRVTAAVTADVRPQVNGIVLQRLFEEGSVVRAGQPLYRIDARLYRAARDQAAAQLANAQAALSAADAQARRYRGLGDTDAVSRQAIDNAVAEAAQARAAVNEYRAALQTARVNLEYTQVLAPITGRISRSSVTKGALVTADQATALATIRQLDPIYVDITQSADQILALRRALAQGSVLPASSAVRLKLSDGTDYGQPGTIEFSEVNVDEQAGTVTLRARFPNPDGILMPGMFVRVEAPQAVVPNGILVPQQGISRDPKGNATALVVDRQNKVERRNVAAAQAIGDKWLITSGLAAGDRLIVEGTDNAAPGSAVKPVAVKPVTVQPGR